MEGPDERVGCVSTPLMFMVSAGFVKAPPWRFSYLPQGGGTVPRTAGSSAAQGACSCRDGEMTLHELVHQAASQHWDRTAVRFDACDGQPPVCHTYGALVTTASRLSRFLLLHCDLEEIRQIGLYCQPGVNLPSWILG